MDCWKHPPSLPPFHINNSAGQVVDSVKFFGTTITSNLKWGRHLSKIIKQAPQRMFFLRLLRKMNASHRVCTQFHRATIECLLTSSITVWFPTSSAHTKKRLERIVGTTGHLTGLKQEPVWVLHKASSRQWARKKVGDPIRPADPCS